MTGAALGTDNAACDDVRAMLRDYGLRSTDQRLAIVRLLTAEKASSTHGHGHMTAAQIHDRLHADGMSIDLTTVYRGLTTLVELGVLHAIAHHSTLTTYGIVGIAHHHAVCTRCGSVIEITRDTAAAALNAMCRSIGFQSDASKVTIHGVCVGCQSS